MSPVLSRSQEHRNLILGGYHTSISTRVHLSRIRVFGYNRATGIYVPASIQVMPFRDRKLEQVYITSRQDIFLYRPLFYYHRFYRLFEFFLKMAGFVPGVSILWKTQSHSYSGIRAYSVGKEFGAAGGFVIFYIFEQKGRPLLI